MAYDDPIQAVAEILRGVEPAPEPRLARVYAGPDEAVNLADFPCAIVYITPLAQHAFREEAVGLARLDYSITILVLVGSRQNARLHELHGRAWRFAKPVARAFYRNLSLLETAMFAGDGDADNTLLTFQVGPLDWNEGKYFGLKINLPVTEKFMAEMDL